MIKFIVGLVLNAVLSMIFVGLWYMFGKIFTGGDYTMNYWLRVQVVFFITIGIDILYSLYKFGNKSSW